MGSRQEGGGLVATVFVKRKQIAAWRDSRDNLEDTEEYPKLD